MLSLPQIPQKSLRGAHPTSNNKQSVKTIHAFSLYKLYKTSINSSTYQKTANVKAKETDGRQDTMRCRGTHAIPKSSTAAVHDL